MPTPPPVPGVTLRDACRQVGLTDATADALLAHLAAAGCVAEPATSRELELMQLLRSPSPDKLVHDLRNVLNELSLLRALVELEPLPPPGRRP